MLINRALAVFCLVFAMWAPEAEGAHREPDFPIPPLLLTSRNRTIYEIVLGVAPAEYEVFAAGELAEFIERGTGARLPVTDEDSRGNRRAVYLGNTVFAAKAGIDPGEFGPEEWIIKAEGDDLIIAGGRPRGTLYGVYEFLEEFAGVRFLNPRMEHVPPLDALEVPHGFEMRGEPAFSRREIIMFHDFGHIERNRVFMVRSRQNTFSNARGFFGSKYGTMKYGYPSHGHASDAYVSAFPEAFDKDEYFAVDSYGNRYERRHLGKRQVCMSHPEVRTIFARKLRVFIERDRREVMDKGLGEEFFPKFYDLSPDDGHSKCYCERCSEREKKYGSYAGVVLEFANWIADDIAGDYPDVFVYHNVYSYYRDLPAGIRPRENVMLRIAQLGSVYWNRPPKRDIHRGILHPLNEDARKEFEQWAGISEKLATWCYWIFHWGQPHQWPHSNVSTIAENLMFYRQQGLSHYYAEAHMLRISLNFLDLKYFMGKRKLNRGPTGNPEPMIDEFMELYYGPAAPAMKKLLGYMERRQEEEPGYLEQVPPEARAYYDAEYFIRADEILSRAEEAVSDNPELFANVRQERLPFDETMIFIWERLTAESGEAWPFDRDELLDRVEENYATLLEKYGGARGHYDMVKERLEFLREGKPRRTWF